MKLKTKNDLRDTLHMMLVATTGAEVRENATEDSDVYHEEIAWMVGAKDSLKFSRAVSIVFGLADSTYFAEQCTTINDATAHIWDMRDVWKPEWIDQAEESAT